MAKKPPFGKGSPPKKGGGFPAPSKAGSAAPMPFNKGGKIK